MLIKERVIQITTMTAYIEEFRQQEHGGTLPVFKLSDLGRLYESRLKEEEKNPNLSVRVNTTDFNRTNL